MGSRLILGEVHFVTPRGSQTLTLMPFLQIEGDSGHMSSRQLSAWGYAGRPAVVSVSFE